MEVLKEKDVSFLVMPKLVQPFTEYPTFQEKTPIFTHFYLLARFFCEKLTDRSYMSAVIFPSSSLYRDVTVVNGVFKGISAGIDAFGRIFAH